MSAGFIDLKNHGLEYELLSIVCRALELTFCFAKAAADSCICDRAL